MIGFLRGILIAKRPPALTLDVGGVGYELEAPMSTFYRLPDTGQTLSLVTHLVVREDAHILFGFFTEAERALFRTLLKLSNVGPRIALGVLSGMSVEGFYQCIRDKNLVSLTKIPGVGRKTAQRLALHLLKVRPEDVEALAEALLDMRRRVRACERCFHLSEDVLCDVCRDPRRDPGLLCVVEEPADVLAFERTGAWAGLYHVLGGALDPLSGVGPDQLRIRELLNRIGERVDGVEVAEVIIATDPNTEGEATATYLVRMLRDIPGLTVTRIASGLPMGGDLEFADELTLGRALSGRRAMA